MCAVKPVRRERSFSTRSGVLYMCPHTTMCALIRLYRCPHTTVCVLILLCPHTTMYVSLYYYICVLILLCACPHTTINAVYYLCCGYRRSAGPLCMCPQPTICVLRLLYVSSDYYMWFIRQVSLTFAER